MYHYNRNNPRAFTKEPQSTNQPEWIQPQNTEGYAAPQQGNIQPQPVMSAQPYIQPQSYSQQSQPLSDPYPIQGQGDPYQENTWNAPLNHAQEIPETRIYEKYKPESFLAMPGVAMDQEVVNQFQTQTYPSQLQENQPTQQGYPTMPQQPRSTADILRQNSFVGNDYHPEIDEKMQALKQKHRPKKINIINMLSKKIFPLIIAACIFIACFLIVKTFIYDISRVSGTSMLPTYKNNDVVDVQKWYYYIKSPTYDDVIIARMDNGDNIMKRIVACPGDTLYIADGVLYVNDIAQVTEFEPMVDAGLATSVIILGEDEYFVLGDNRNGSADSRSEKVGIVNKSQIEGKVVNKLPKWLGKFD